MSELPALLSNQAEHQWLRFLPLVAEEAREQVLSREPEIRRAFALSDFIAESAITCPALLPTLLARGDLHSAARYPQYAGWLQARLETVFDEESLKRQLRLFRREAMVAIAWRELLGLSSVEESFVHLSALADTLIGQARDWLYAKACRDSGTPQNAAGEVQRLVILGMGKLGGGELNFSSDIDLIFCYPDNGQTVGGRRSVENQTFFIRLGQQLINVLHQPTRDGQVYRVDMRLRPFGDAGPLAISFAAMEDYYQHHGRSWERYAMVKARVLGDATPEGEALQALLKPFVYRRYIDFGAIDALRKMKGMIEAEVRRKGLTNNIKLGAGGIRDIEFIAQAWQLIRGGREPALQIRHLPDVLATLGRTGDLAPASAESLIADYRRLRRIENILQEIGDQQTQTLPDSPRDQARLVAALGEPDWETFYAGLQQLMVRVHREFATVVGEAEQAPEDVPQLWSDLWLTPLTEAETLPLLTPLYPADPAGMTHQLVTFRTTCQRRSMGPQGREALNRLMPRLLWLICAAPQAEALFARIQDLLLCIMTRSAYLQLLVENQGVLRQLLRLCAASEVIARQLARFPILLDELLDPQQLYNPIPLAAYRGELQQYLMRIPEEDVEQQMEALRQFKQIQLLRISAADIAGALPLMKVSDHLTWLAEAILEEVVNEAWSQLTERHGMPAHCRASGERDFCVVAYGKLGGIELGYGSDLDLVFLHSDAAEGMTDGARPLDVRQFYVRLAQRILHLFSTRTPSGILYEVDMRLRPSGEAGLLVTTLSAYEHYLQQEAWTWELQALVRARAVVGVPALVDGFNQVRQRVLARPRDLHQLGSEVVAMRDKMRQHLLRGGAGEYDLKQGAGGMTDIEFIAQYLVLAHAAVHPDLLTRWSDNVRIFEACVETGLLSAPAAQQLRAAYLAIRDLAHRCTLSGRSRIVTDSELVAERAAVVSVWQQLLGAYGHPPLTTAALPSAGD